MTCPKCGTNSRNAGFCPGCGEKMPEIQQPVQPEFKGIATNKTDFVNHFADPETKKKDQIRKILSIACAALLLICYLIVTNVSIENIAVVKRLSGGENLDYEKAALRESVEDAYEMLEEYEDDFSKKDVKLMKKFLKSAEKMSKRISINNMKKFAKRLNALKNTEILREFSGYDFDDYTDVAGSGLSVLSNFFLIFALICIALVFCGGWFRITPLVVIGMIVTMAYTWWFCGFIWLLLNLAAHIFLIVCTTSVNKEYKIYRGAVAYR